EGCHYDAVRFPRGQGLDMVLHDRTRPRRAGPARPGEPPEAPPVTNGQHRHALSASIAQGLASGHFPDAGVTPVAASGVSAQPTATLVTPPFTSWGGEGRSDSPPSSTPLT